MMGKVLTLWVWAVCLALGQTGQPFQRYYSWEGSGEEEIQDNHNILNDLNVGDEVDEGIVADFIDENLELNNEKIVSYNESPVKNKNIVNK
jgi:hypothetical protein